MLVDVGTDPVATKIKVPKPLQSAYIHPQLFILGVSCQIYSLEKRRDWNDIAAL